eukprot:sb/3463194/
MYRDLLLALSGHAGSVFVRDSGGEFRISEDTPCLAPQEAALLNRILKLAGHHYAISNFTSAYRNIIKIRRAKLKESVPPNAGLYTAALSFDLDRGMKQYSDVLIELDKLVRQNPNMPLSLLQFHLDRFQYLFPTLSSIINEIKNNLSMKGCKILGMLHEQSACGIPFVKDLLAELLQSCHSVFYQQLSAWVLHGKVEDPFGEFFIAPSGDGREEEEGGLLANYTINWDMVPGYFSKDIINTILFVGSSVHVFSGRKYSSNPLAKEDEDHFVTLIQGLQRRTKFCPIEFERVVGVMRERVAMQLYNLLMEEGKLMDILRLFKEFFLLGRGELFLTFIDVAEPLIQNLCKKNSESDVNRLFLKSYHTLGFSSTNTVEKFRLQFEKREGSTDRWSDLKLTYDVQWPLHILFTTDVMDDYNRIFVFLLKLRRCQLALQAAWSTSTRSEDRFDHRLLNLRSNVAYLIDNLQYYLHVDVLETNFTELTSKLNATQDFEQIRKAHRFFLGEILAWSFVSNELNSATRLIDTVISLGFQTAKMFEEDPDEIQITKLESNYNFLVAHMLKMLESSASRQHNSFMNQLLLRIDYNGFFTQVRAQKLEKKR